MRLRIGCHFVFTVDHPTHSVLIVEPHPDEASRVVEEQFTTDPAVETSRYQDAAGTRCRRLTLPVGRVELDYQGLVEDDGLPDPIDPQAAHVPVADLPDETLTYLLPSRYCQSDQVGDLAFQTFGSIEGGWAKAQAISAWVHDHIEFNYGIASPNFTALDVLESGTGVCRDYTHLMIALCRAINIPARYVFGYLPDIAVPDPGLPMDFCAWVEVYVGDRWYTFDPRNHQHRIGRVVIGRGHDAADVAMVTSFGRVGLDSMTVTAEEA